jgi:hypothetical protein
LERICEIPHGNSGLRETPQALKHVEAPALPAERERLERKSTGKINRAKKKESESARFEGSKKV